jgi:hypothetical protein
MSRFRQFGQRPFGQSNIQVENVAGHIHPRTIEQARQSGRLNISNRNLKEIPDTIWKMYDPDALAKEQKNYVDLSKSSDAWWEIVDLTWFSAADNELEILDEQISNFPALVHLDVSTLLEKNDRCVLT